MRFLFLIFFLLFGWGDCVDLEVPSAVRVGSGELGLKLREGVGKWGREKQSIEGPCGPLDRARKEDRTTTRRAEGTRGWNADISQTTSVGRSGRTEERMKDHPRDTQFGQCEQAEALQLFQKVQMESGVSAGIE